MTRPDRTPPPAARLPAWGRVLVVAAVVWLVVALAAMGAVVVALSTAFFVPPGDDARCRVGLGVSCADVPVADIEAVTGMDLPEDTLIESTSYTAFQDWSLEATFVVPPGQVAVWEASVDEYTETSPASCTGLGDRGTDRRCAEVTGATNPYLRYVRATADDGSVIVAVHAFTT